MNLRRAMTAAVLVIPFSLGALPATAQDIVDAAVSAVRPGLRSAVENEVRDDA